MKDKFIIFTATILLLASLEMTNANVEKKAEKYEKAIALGYSGFQAS